LADSQATKQDLIELLGVPPEKIAVVYGGIEARFSPAADPAGDAMVRQKYGLEQPYMFTLGTLEPRKNYVRLMRAYHRLSQEAGSVPPLIVAGGKGWLYEDIFAEVERLGLGERVRFLGYVQDTDLPALYRGAELFVFPSLYEGFGFPPLEAMACGCPVVCSNSSSLPEVVGDAAILVDPTDEEQIARALYAGLTEATLRERLIERGLARAALFTWPAAARRLVAEYERLYQEVER